MIPLALNAVSLVSAGLITRALRTEDFGRFSLGTAVVGVTTWGAELGLRARTARQLSIAGAGVNRALCDILSLRILLATIATLATFAIAAVIPARFGLGTVILVTSLTIIPVTISGTLSDGLMARNRTRQISRAAMWAGIALTIASVVAALKWRSASALAAAYVIGPCVNMILLARYSRLEYGAVILRWRPRQWLSLMHRAAPFFGLGVLSMIAGRLDTIVIGTLFGSASAGIYTASTTLADRLWIVIDSVASAVLPTLARLRHESGRLQEVLGEVMYPLLAILTGGALIAMAGATAAVTVVFGSTYAPGGPALAAALVLLPVLALDNLLGEAFMASRRDKLTVRTAALGQVASMLLLPVLPFVFGIAGVRLAHAGAGVSALLRFNASRAAFPGLWDRTRVRRLTFSVFLSLPIVALLILVHFRPFVAVLVAGGGFAAWALVAARRWGLFPAAWGILSQADHVGTSRQLQ